MEKAKLLPLIAALYLLEIKERMEYIKAAAKESGVGEGDLFTALKEAGYNPKAEKGSPAPDGSNETRRTPGKQGGSDAGKITVTLRHTTEYPRYRRAGLVLQQSAREFQVTAEQLAVLEKDTWVQIVSGGKPQ